jgi:hypothetical protein
MTEELHSFYVVRQVVVVLFLLGFKWLMQEGLMSVSGSFRMRYMDTVETQNYGSEMITLLRKYRY